MYLSVEGLSKAYGSGSSHVQVLKNVDLEIDAGQVCVILGASGSGKSTLLNCIGGLDHPDDGQIRVGETAVTSLSARGLTDYRRNVVGFIFQFYNLVPNLTVKENIQVSQRLTRDPLDLDDLIRSLGLWDHQNKFPSQLSGGQQQRCAIARALVKKSELLLCDEPTGALDYATSIEMLEVLETVNHQYDTTIVVVTHNSAIAAMGHSVIEIKDGSVTNRRTNAEPQSARSLTW